MVHGGIGAWHGGMALHGGALYGGSAFFFDRTRHKE